MCLQCLVKPWKILFWEALKKPSVGQGSHQPQLEWLHDGEVFLVMKVMLT